MTVCKRNKDSQLRYFAIPEQPKAQTGKRILAAIEGTPRPTQVLAGGFRRRGLRGQQAVHGPQIGRGEADREGGNGEGGGGRLPFRHGRGYSWGDTDELMANFSNLHRMVAEFYELLADGVASLDAVVSVLGRKAAELAAKHPKNAQAEVFLLVLLVEDRIAQLVRPKTTPNSQN